MSPTHLDLFSGIGGFALAARGAGFRTIGFSEIEPYASAVLKKHWPKVKNYGDLRNVPPIRCDILTGGFPCQPFSVAGKQEGAADDRFLWPTMCDVIKICRPTWVLGENVTGIISMELDRCITDLENLGYEVQPIIIPACAVGAWHRRDRVWIIAHNRKIRGERFVQKKICRQSGFQRCEDVGRIAHEFPRPDLYSPTLCGGGDGIREELGAIGNAIVPQVAEIILKEIYRISYL